MRYGIKESEHRLVFTAARHFLPYFVCVAALTAGSCKEFATPAELSRTQILAVVTEPPAVPPGGRSALSILVADQSGQVEEPTVAWASVSPLPDADAIGEVEIDAEGNVQFVAPPEQPEDDPALAMVEATVTDDPEEASLLALKAVIVSRLPLVNPSLATLEADGTDLLGVGHLALRRDQTVTLNVEIDPPATEDSMYSWYCTIGTIEAYRSNPADLVADESGEGWLFVVVRDGRGGVVWHKASVTIE